MIKKTLIFGFVVHDFGNSFDASKPRYAYYHLNQVKIWIDWKEYEVIVCVHTL